MAARPFWQRFRGLDFNFEQFRSELSDETQIAEALPDNARADYLRNRAREEQGLEPATGSVAESATAGGEAAPPEPNADEGEQHQD